MAECKPYQEWVDTHHQPHDHIWQVLNVQHPPVLRPGIQSPTTIVLMTCKDCHWPATVTLSGKWDLEQLR